VHHQHRRAECHQAQRDEVLADVERRLRRQARDGDGRIGRPRQVYTGETQRSYIPMDQRK
jgi:hypothetical protein